jgi:hypothetical protein
MKATITEADIRRNLETNPKWVERALIRLFERQTSYERAAERTHNLNMRGFQPCDAFMFSRFAKYLTERPGRSLSPKQLAYCGVRDSRMPNLRLRMWRGAPAICKYAKQLLDIIEEDAKTKADAAS